MAINKGTPYQDDDGLKKEILDTTDPRYQVPMAPHPTGDPVAPAKSPWAFGRGCPKCAGQLRFREYNKEKDVIILSCKNCAATWHERDLHAHQDHDPIGNNFNFVNIPVDMMQRWMDAREEEKKRKGEWT